MTTSGVTYTVLFWRDEEAVASDDQAIRALAASIRQSIERDGAPAEFVVLDRESGGDRFWRAWSGASKRPERLRNNEGGGV